MLVWQNLCESAMSCHLCEVVGGDVELGGGGGGTSSQYQNSYFDLAVRYYLVMTCLVFVLKIQIETQHC